MGTTGTLVACGVVVAIVGVFLPVYGLTWIAALVLFVMAGIEWHRGRDRRAHRKATRRALLDAARKDR